MSGFIKLYRSCRHNILWQDKPFTKWQAFEDLMLSAAYEPTAALIKGQIVNLNRGQLIRGMHKLAAEWGWSVKKTIAFIKLLERQKMVIAKGTPQGTLITILNYAFYQDGGRVEKTVEGIAKAVPKRHQRGEEEEKKEIKEVKEIYKELPIALVEPFEAYLEMRKQIKAPLTERSMKIVLKKLNELSGGDEAKALRIIEEATVNCWKSFYPSKYGGISKSNSEELANRIARGDFNE